MSNFKSNYTLDQRKNEASKMRIKYPDRIPVIVQKSAKSSVQDIDKHKYLVPADLNVGTFMNVIRQRIKLDQSEGIFLFINNTIPPCSDLLSSIYKNNKDEDGFLYVYYQNETVYG
jgi:GABA(A) receptor-associated protein